MKTLVIGIDGGTFDLIKPWAEAGKLPMLNKLMNEGVYSEMITTYPPLTGPAWVSMATGCNPGKHGIFDFMAPEIGKIRINNSTKIKVPTLWQILSKNEINSSVVNVPMTYPPTPIKGYMISSIMSGKGEISYPPELLKEVEKGSGVKYKIGLNAAPQEGNEEAHIRETIEWQDSVTKTAFYMLDNKECDFFMVVFPIVDATSHSYYKYMEEGGEFQDQILKAYQIVDETIGKMLDYADDETNVLLVSDHGFGPLKGMVNVNNFFIRKGLIKFKFKGRLRSFLFKHGLTPKKLYGVLKKLGLAGLARAASQKNRNKVLESFLGFRDMDMKRTIAYSKGHVGQVHINKDALQNLGLSYEEARAKTIEVLKEMKHPETGEPLVTQILVKEELYQGDYIDLGPDIFVVFDNFNYYSYPLFAADNKIITTHMISRSGTHRMNGMFLGYGPYFGSKGKLSEPMSITDITPTVLDIFGIDIPNYIDGKAVTGRQ